MALPLSRDVSYSSNAPVNAANLNAIQDCLIAGKHGPITLVYGANAFAASRLSTVNLSVGDATVSIGGGVVAAVELALALPVGTKLKSATYYGSNPSGATVNVEVLKSPITSTGGVTTIVAATQAAGAAWGPVTLAVADHVIAADDRTFVFVSASVSGFVVGGLKLQITKE